MEERRGCRRPRSGRAQGCGASSVVCGAVCGRIGRERGHSGPAFDRAGSRVLAGGSAVGGFGLRVVLCGLLAPDGEGGGSVGQEEDLRCGTALFTAASLSCGLSVSPETLVVSRAFQGLGAATTAPAALSSETAPWPPGRRWRRVVG